MAHHLTKNEQTGKYEMAFVGELPWHGLGQRVALGCSVDEMRIAAGLNWDAREAIEQYSVAGSDVEFSMLQTGQLFFYGGIQYVKTDDFNATSTTGLTTGANFADIGTVQACRIMRNDDRKIIHRSDTGAVVGAVGSNYKTVQPRAVLEFFRDLTEAGDWHIHTAGSMHGGSRIWAMASNHTEGEVIEGDRIKGNLLLATSLDGTMKTIAAMTAIRVVCANTLRLALSEYGKARTHRNGVESMNVNSSAKKADGTRDCLAISHRSEFNPDNIKKELGLARESFDRFIKVGAELAATPCDFEEAREILRALFGQPLRTKLDHEPSKPLPVGVQDGSDFAALMARPVGVKPDADGNIKREQKSVETCLALFSGAGMGSDHPGSKDTRWGLMNAITQHIDHNMGRNADTRMSNAWFGTGNDKKTEALAMLTAGTAAATA